MGERLQQSGHVFSSPDDAESGFLAAFVYKD
jgi:hypothetical protein